MINWYNCLGNHDYSFNPDKQVIYKSPNNNRWKMYNKYYYKRMHINNFYISLIVLDTTPLNISNQLFIPDIIHPCNIKIYSPYDKKFCKNYKFNIQNSDVNKQLKFLNKMVNILKKLIYAESNK